MNLNISYTGVSDHMTIQYMLVWFFKLEIGKSTRFTSITRGQRMSEITGQLVSQVFYSFSQKTCWKVKSSEVWGLKTPYAVRDWRSPTTLPLPVTLVWWLLTVVAFNPSVNTSTLRGKPTSRVVALGWQGQGSTAEGSVSFRSDWHLLLEAREVL